MSKRVQIAVIREANLNAKPTETHYLAEGGLQISRKDAVALKGTTLYYTVMVDLGVITGSDFIPGRDVPVYLTDSDPVLAFQPHFLHWVEPEALINPETVKPIPLEALMEATGVVTQESAPASQVAPEAPAKRRPGRPRKTPAPDPIIPEAAPEPIDNVLEVPVVVEVQVPVVEVPIQISEAPDFEVTAENAPQDDESTFLIEPTGAPARPAQPEFSFDTDEDEQPAPPPVRNVVENLGFEIEPEEDENPEPADVQGDVSPTVQSDTDDYSGVDTGMFDE